VLGLADLRALQGRTAVVVRDRLALEPNLLAGRRHRNLLLLGHDILAQSCPALLDSLCADPKLLFGPCHRVIS
jgi:hypothetical protein